MVNCKHFDAKVEVEHIVADIRTYFATNGTPDTKAIIGISGGKDSTIAAALLVRALGAERVFGVLMPDGEQKDIDDSIKVCEILGIEYITININESVRSIYEGLTNHWSGISIKGNNTLITNTPARIRMTTLYSVAAMVGGRVINTGNASEAYVGYTTKYGDLAGDYAILKNYFIREVYAIGDALEELPRDLVHKAPADGMSGKTDEDKLGYTYAEIDAFVLDDVIPEDIKVFSKMIADHNRNIHKRVINLPAPYPKTRYDVPEHRFGVLNYGNITENCCEWYF